jgi:hypothetical protein
MKKEKLAGRSKSMNKSEIAERAQTIKVISLWEPWATAMRLGLKNNETRSWWCGHRGWLAVQAAKKVYKPSDYEFDFNQAVQSAGIWPHHLTTTYGSVLCIVCKSRLWNRKPRKPGRKKGTKNV